MYENIKRYKYEILQIHIKKNINVKNVKGYVKKVNVYMRNYKVQSNRNVNKETNKQNKEKYLKITYIYIYIYIYIQKRNKNI